MSPLLPQPISPLDGRYRAQVAPLSIPMSEAGLNRARIQVEIEWLLYLSGRSLFGSSPVTEEQAAALRAVVANFDESSIAELAATEATTRHDVKAVEYFVRARLSELGLDRLAELTHFACTSEDINNLSYGLTVREALHEAWLPRLRALIASISDKARAYKAVPLLARTHGQPATPTTMGKELAVFAWRLQRVVAQIEQVQILGKFSGATGTFAAHLAAGPDLDWPAISREFVESLGLTWNPLTTQIESHDWMVELFGRVRHVNGILHNLATDVWSYISIGYFRQRPVAGATGSSTMPHKVNPIRFENAEANLELSNAVLGSLADTLVTSRWQRDLTDSSAQRNIGVGFGHSLLALENLITGLTELDLAEDLLAADLDSNWEVLGEAIQTVIRAEVTAGRSQISDPYALLKELTRGKRVGAEDLAAFVAGLDLPDDAKARLTALTPATYVGLAEQLVDYLP